ncbi:carbon-nitrogen hydrolase [Cucurbitaria berberidis CBS 394.84]|uniref:Carbon-nitrogen hydrolase n=1 Tax=Cucurbitaria berberidis CBS 394.84 TaxID=1168544 RepID=A0A9P4G862_9PLEO|nr:carbon-nitrogen hydrolase [Cucurbitaria berberidis CBS 394.84]KAF1840686.1 carbon-nitrogen hydrolase [Cucurbitaria berberidis CBS 394.84]
MPLAAVGQIRSTASIAHNLSQCQKLVQRAKEAGAKALFLPEASDYIAINGNHLCKSVEESDFVLGLQREAKRYSLPINVGVHEPAADQKVKNTSLWIDETGSITQRYQKLHLFDVDIKNGPQLKESNSVERGKEILAPFATPVGSVGLQICFDLRFPEPALALRARGAQILTYPSAFTVPTGNAGHWEILLRARAIETQSYVVAAAQVGVHDEEGKRRSYGHSMIVDPWGKIIAELGGEDDDKGRGLNEGEIALAEIDLENLEKVRREVPLIRRTDVYPEIV